MALQINGLLVTLDGTKQKLATLISSILPAGNQLVAGVTVTGKTVADLVYVGHSNLAGAATAIGEVAAGVPWYGSVPAGEVLNIANLYLLGTNNDTVYVNVLS